MSDTYRKESRRDWTRPGTVTIEDIKLGALQRIADACERMNEGREAAERRVKYLESQLADEIADAARLRRSNASLRGVITRLKGRVTK